MAYPSGYDNFSRSHSRRPSIIYGSTPMPFQQQVIFPDGHGHPDYRQESYQNYGPPMRAATMPINHRLTGPSYDDLDIREHYYPGDRQLSSHHHPMVSHSTTMGPRHRRHSTVSYTTRTAPVIDAYHGRPSSLKVKFKRKGSFMAGISLAEAQDHVRLSGNDSYRMHDFHADGRNRILLRIQWSGYSPMTYEIPLEAYDGRISLETIARRISRACVHYLQANIIPVVWDRVQLHHLEEISYGVWQPMLSTR